MGLNDSNLRNVIYFKLTTIATGTITIVILSFMVSPELRGFYYTFMNIIAARAFLELGIGYSITQFVSHEKKNLKWHKHGRGEILDGDKQSLANVRALFLMIIKWQTLAAIILILILIPGGILFFLEESKATSMDIIAPWLIIVIASSLHLPINGFLSILEGGNRVGRVANIRMYMSVFGAIANCSVLLIAESLFGLSLMFSVSTLLGVLIIYFNYKEFIISLLRKNYASQEISWTKDVLPFQWRLGASWVAGYIGFQILTPIVFYFHGPISAGKLGISLHILFSMFTIFQSWITSKIPLFGILVASNKIDELKNKCFTASVQSGSLLILTILVFIVTAIYIGSYYTLFSDVLVGLGAFMMLALAVILNHLTSSMAAFLRAFKVEPLVKASFMGSLTTLLIALLLVPNYPLVGVSISFASGSLVGFVASTFIFVRFVKQYE